MEPFEGRVYVRIPTSVHLDTSSVKRRTNLNLLKYSISMADQHYQKDGADTQSKGSNLQTQLEASNANLADWKAIQVMKLKQLADLRARIQAFKAKSDPGQEGSGLERTKQSPKEPSSK